MSFVWGTVGGGIGWLCLFLAPWAAALQSGKAKLSKLDLSRIIGALLTFVCYVALGGVAGLLAGGDSRADIVAGIGGQAMIKALTKGDDGELANRDKAAQADPV